MQRLTSFLSIIATLTICFSLLACGQNGDPNLSAELTPEEQSMPEAKYYSTDFAPVPDEVMEGLAWGPIPENKAVPFEKINELLKPGYLEMENGYSILKDGSAYVAVRTDLPGVTYEMMRWWFWWHALKDIRYKIWCPGDHYAIDVADKQRLADESLSYDERFLKNPHYPVEDVGPGPTNLSIRFVSPETFGFNVSDFSKNGIEGVTCAVVGFRNGQSTLEHTYMCHIFRKKGDGLELRSRFWLGKKLNMPNIRKMISTEDTAMDMAMHCTREFNHLAGILPAVYDEFADQSY